MSDADPNKGARPEPAGTRLRFRTDDLKSTYCNMCNATSTREEVVLNFGINENWDRNQQEVDVQLQHRIILSPFAAKRLLDMLQKLMVEHEARYGKLSV
jgi:Protein of unknown function (DUF3467)